MGIEKKYLKPENWEYLKQASEKKYGHKKAQIRYIEHLIESDKNNNEKNKK